MALYQKYAEKPRTFLALTGYTREEFDHLLPNTVRIGDTCREQKRQ